jgi:hypothetical protein
MSEFKIFIDENDEYEWENFPIKGYHCLVINELDSEGNCEGSIRFENLITIKKLSEELNKYIKLKEASN